MLGSSCKILTKYSTHAGLHKKEWDLKSGKNHQSNLFSHLRPAQDQTWLLAKCKEWELVAKHVSPFLSWESLWGANLVLISSYKKLLKDMSEDIVGICTIVQSPRAHWESNISSCIVILSSGIIYPETEKKLFHFIMSDILDHRFLTGIFFVDNMCYCALRRNYYAKYRNGFYNQTMNILM